MIKIDRNKSYWNLVRGICILCVLLIHITSPVYADGVVRFEWFILRRIIAFPVAVFFFMAGFFVRLDKVHDRKYLLEKVKRILIPYLSFSAIYIAENCLLGSNANIKGIFVSLFLGTSEVQMYFLLYLLQMILLLPFITRMMYSKRRNIWFIITIFLSVTFVILRQLPNLKAILSPWCVPFLCFYVLGVYINGWQRKSFPSRFLDKYLHYNFKWQIVFVILTLVLAICEGLLSVSNRFDLSQVMPANYLYCFTMIGLFYYIYLTYLPANRIGGGGVKKLVGLDWRAVIYYLSYTHDNYEAFD